MTQKHILHKGDADRARILQNLHTFLDRLPDTQSWCVEVKRHVRERTEPQLRYLNGVAYKILGDHLGYERDEIAEEMNGEYFGWTERKMPSGRVKRVPLRTTTTNERGEREVLDAQQFANYVDFVQRFAAEQGCYIPDPEKQVPEHAR